MIGKPRALRRLDLNCGAYMIGNGNSDIGCLCQWFVLARPTDQWRFKILSTDPVSMLSPYPQGALDGHR